MITQFLLACAGLFTVIGLIVSKIRQLIKVRNEVAADAAVRAERLQALTTQTQAAVAEVKNEEPTIESYEHDYGVKLVHPVLPGDGDSGK